MKSHFSRRWIPALVLGLGLTAGTRTFGAQTIQITVTNAQPAGGFSITPVWFGLHDGSFDLFNSGEPASAQIEAVAELGDPGPLASVFAGHGVGTVLVSPSGAPPFMPGESGSTTLDVTDPATTRFLSFAAMVVPSNDLFVGNTDPTSIPIFDALGNFVGPQTLFVFGRMVWDAGTEVNEIQDGAAFIAGLDATLGATEGGNVGLFLNRPDSGAYLGTILGLTTADGGSITRLFGPDDLIATIRIEAVPEPATLSTAALAIGAGLALAWRRRR